MKPIYSLEGVVAVFCDPERFGALLEPQQQSMLLAEYRNNFAFAIHPKKAAQVLDDDGRINAQNMANLSKLTSWPRLATFGEIGIDYTNAKRNWPAQSSVLIQMLTAFRDGLVAARLPIVVHYRNTKYSLSKSLDASEKVMEVIEGILGNCHPIQVHHFQGNAREVERWLKRFPNAYFSVPVRSMLSITTAQREGWRAIPLNRLLLETDAPYGAEPNDWRPFTIPYDLAQDCGEIAKEKQVHKRQLLSLTLMNARSFFNIQYFDVQGQGTSGPPQ